MLIASSLRKQKKDSFSKTNRVKMMGVGHFSDNCIGTNCNAVQERGTEEALPQASKPNEIKLKEPRPREWVQPQE